MNRQSADMFRDVSRVIEEYNQVIRSVAGHNGGQITLVSLPEDGEALGFLESLHNKMNAHKLALEREGAIEEAEIIGSYLRQLEDWHAEFASG